MKTFLPMYVNSMNSSRSAARVAADTAAMVTVTRAAAGTVDDRIAMVAAMAATAAMAAEVVMATNSLPATVQP